MYRVMIVSVDGSQNVFLEVPENVVEDLIPAVVTGRGFDMQSDTEGVVYAPGNVARMVFTAEEEK